MLSYKNVKTNFNAYFNAKIELKTALKLDFLRYKIRLML